MPTAPLRHITGLAAGLLFLASCGGPSGEQVKGVAGTQPATQIVLLDDSKAVDLRPIIERAQSELRRAGVAEKAWPEPSRIVEQQDAWLLWFDYKMSRVEVNGQETIREQSPGAVQVVVSKTDATAHIVPGR